MSLYGKEKGARGLSARKREPHVGAGGKPRDNVTHGDSNATSSIDQTCETVRKRPRNSQKAGRGRSIRRALSNDVCLSSRARSRFGRARRCRLSIFVQPQLSHSMLQRHLCTFMQPTGKNIGCSATNGIPTMPSWNPIANQLRKMRAARACLMLVVQNRTLSLRASRVDQRHVPLAVAVAAESLPEHCTHACKECDKAVKRRNTFELKNSHSKPLESEHEIFSRVLPSQSQNFHLPAQER